MKVNRKMSNMKNEKKKKKSKRKSGCCVWREYLYSCEGGRERRGREDDIYRDDKDEINKFSLCPGNLIE